MRGGLIGDKPAIGFRTLASEGRIFNGSGYLPDSSGASISWNRECGYVRKTYRAKLTSTLITLVVLSVSFLAVEAAGSGMKLDESLNLDLEESVSSFDTALQTDPENYGIWMNRGRSLASAGKLNESLSSYQNALDLIDEVLKKYPQNAEAWKTQGSAFAYLGRLDDAMKSYQMAIEISNQTLKNNPEDAEAWWLIAESLEILGNDAAAIAAYDKVIELNSSKAASAWMRKADLSEYNDSIDAFDKATELMPKGAGRKLESVWTEHNASILVELWSDSDQMLRVSLGRYNESSKAYDHILKINSQAVSVHLVDPSLKRIFRQNLEGQA